MKTPTAAALLLMAAACSMTGRGGEDPLYSGTIEAVEVDVVPEVSGRILTRPVDQGYAVAVGDVIATIDAEPYRIALAETEAALSSARSRRAMLSSGYRMEEVEGAAREVEGAEAQLAQAEARIRRVEELVSGQISTPDELDVARRDRDVARARLEGARQRHALLTSGYRVEEVEETRSEVRRHEAVLEQRQLDLERTTVRSPVAGTVTEKIQEPGEYARPGSPIVSVADLVNLFTWVYLGEAELPRIRLGDEVAVRVDAFPEKDFPGKVVYISTEAEFTPRNVQTAEDRLQLVYGVKVSVLNQDGALKVGIPADVLLRRHDAP